MKTIKIMDPTKVGFTADFHLYHLLMWKLRQGFLTVEEMSEYLLGIIQSLPSDFTIIHAGDLALKHPELVQDGLNKRKCRFINVEGNHSHIENRIKDIENYERLYLKVKDGEEFQGIYIAHFAHRVWDKSHYGTWHLYGHSHGSLPDDPNALSMDIGIDTNDLKIYSYEDVKSHMSKKTFKPIDHHKPK